MASDPMLAQSPNSIEINRETPSSEAPPGPIKCIQVTTKTQTIIQVNLQPVKTRFTHAFAVGISFLDKIHAL